MADYYTILGVPKTATDLEIKAAFRKLAKIYHPDKNPTNPNAKQFFQTILKAYHVLSNPNSRRRYDLSHSQPDTSHHQKQQYHRRRSGKDKEVTEQELKRREYYRNHYQAKQKTAPPLPTQRYSDYKYILFATPIAVGLLMLIVSVLNPTPQPPVTKQEPKVVITRLSLDSIDTTQTK